MTDAGTGFMGSHLGSHPTSDASSGSVIPEERRKRREKICMHQTCIQKNAMSKRTFIPSIVVPFHQTAWERTRAKTVKKDQETVIDNSETMGVKQKTQQRRTKKQRAGDQVRLT
mmetsp:Transcript_30538/g.60030  ORF Transcript_30538/g.60030 Transcript_30538/m.60030 type:complete len:114 (+) Transcript_30538:180-521(+)